MRKITIEVLDRTQIKATDSEEQYIIITRLADQAPSDDAKCHFESKLILDKTPMVGTCKWRDAFAYIAFHLGVTVSLPGEGH